MHTFELMRLNPRLSGGLLAPSIKMYKRDVYPTMMDIIHDNQIPHDYNKSDLLWYFPDTDSQMYVFHDDDKGMSIRGPTLAWGAINEVTLIGKGAFDAFVARIRHKDAKCMQIAMSGTPEDFGWVYDFFWEHPRADTNLVQGKSVDNIHVHKSYFSNLASAYDSQLRKRYIDGEWVNLMGGRAAWSFDRKKHVANKFERVRHAQVCVSMDFNVDPMSCTLWSRLSPQNKVYPGKEWIAWDEIIISDSNTYELADALNSKLGVELDSGDMVIPPTFIYPDPTGASRSTKSLNMTDIDILVDKGFSPDKGHEIRYKSKIPSVKDCLNAMNAQLDKNTVGINPRCKSLVADLEQVIIKSGSNFELDKSNPKRTHSLDGMKNMFDYECHIAGKRKHKTWRYR